jgi:hypothetical protein
MTDNFSYIDGQDPNGIQTDRILDEQYRQQREAAIQAAPGGTPLPVPSDVIQPGHPNVLDLQGAEGASSKLAALRHISAKKKELVEELKDLQDQEETLIGDIKDLVGGDDSPVDDIRYAGKPFATWKVTRQKRLNQKRLRATVGEEIFETLKDEIVFRSFKVLPTPEEE